MKRGWMVAGVAAACAFAATPVLAEPAVDVDRYRTDGGEYAFTYHYEGADPACIIADEPTTIQCVVSPPAGTRIGSGARSVRPNAIEITEKGWRYREFRPETERRRALPDGARLSVLGASCTALRGGGLECAVDGVGFKQSDGTFSTKGKRLT